MRHCEKNFVARFFRVSNRVSLRIMLSTKCVKCVSFFSTLKIQGGGELRIEWCDIQFPGKLTSVENPSSYSSFPLFSCQNLGGCFPSNPTVCFFRLRDSPTRYCCSYSIVPQTPEPRRNLNASLEPQFSQIILTGDLKGFSPPNLVQILKETVAKQPIFTKQSME